MLSTLTEQSLPVGPVYEMPYYAELQDDLFRRLFEETLFEISLFFRYSELFNNKVIEIAPLEDSLKIALAELYLLRRQAEPANGMTCYPNTSSTSSSSLLSTRISLETAIKI